MPTLHSHSDYPSGWRDAMHMENAADALANAGMPGAEDSLYRLTTEVLPTFQRDQQLVILRRAMEIRENCRNKIGF